MSNLVDVKISVLPEPPPRKFPYLMVGYSDPDRYCAVVFSLEDAQKVFESCPSILEIYCIDMPSVKLCTSLAQAREWYLEL